MRKLDFVNTMSVDNLKRIICTNILKPSELADFTFNKVLNKLIKWNLVCSLLDKYKITV